MAASPAQSVEQLLAAKVAELSQIEQRIERRVEHLTRTETNLKGLFDSLRQQIAAAYPVIDQLNKAMPVAQKQMDDFLTGAKAQIKDAIETTRKQVMLQSDQSFEKMLNLSENADKICNMINDRIRASIDEAKTELSDMAGPIRQQMIDDLRASVEAAKAAKPIPALPAHEEAQKMLADLADAFKTDARQTLVDLRRKLIEEVDILQTDVRLKVNPMLSEVLASKASAEAQIRAITNAADANLQARVQQLRQSADDISQALEDRLSARVLSIGSRATETVEAIENQLRERMSTIVENIETQVDEKESGIRQRILDIRPNMGFELSEIERDFALKLHQFEQHAATMTQYLERKLTDKVEDLIARLRLSLQSEMNRVSNLTPPPPTAPNAGALNKPSVEVDLYIPKRPVSQQQSAA